MKEIFYKEFSFENINKLTLSKGLKIFLGEFAEKIQVKRVRFRLLAFYRLDFAWNERNIKFQVKSSLVLMDYFERVLSRSTK